MVNRYVPRKLPRKAYQKKMLVTRFMKSEVGNNSKDPVTTIRNQVQSLSDHLDKTQAESLL